MWCHSCGRTLHCHIIIQMCSSTDTQQWAGMLPHDVISLGREEEKERDTDINKSYISWCCDELMFTLQLSVKHVSTSGWEPNLGQIQLWSGPILAQIRQTRFNISCEQWAQFIHVTAISSVLSFGISALNVFHTHWQMFTPYLPPCTFISCVQL